MKMKGAEQIKPKLGKLRALSVKRSLLRPFVRLFYWGLQQRFHFGPWHKNNSFYDRPYKALAVQMANELRPKVVVDVGCGLGEILARVDAPLRVGYDTEEGAIKAARLLYGRRATFLSGSLQDVREKRIDLLILLGWAHVLSPEKLAALLEPLLGRCTYLLLDTINNEVPGYPFYHDYHFLYQHAELIGRRDGGFGEPRTLLLFQVKG